MAALLTVAVYSIGAGRAYDYDSSETVGSFVGTRSLLDPFRRQLQFNNHPLFSFLDHLVYSAGGHSEAALRALPIVCGAATVGAVTGWAAARWGPQPGIAAGVLLAADPSFATVARSVRGYSLLTLSAVASTFLLVELLEGHHTRLRPVYAATIAAGVATHLYALFFLLAQLAVLLSRRRARRPLLGWWLVGLLLGGTAYLGLARRMASAALREHGRLQPRFPLEAAKALLGSSSAAIALFAVLVVVGLFELRRMDLLVAGSALATSLGVVWLVLTPHDLYPRFVIWLAPAGALLAAAATRRWPVTLSLVAVAAVAMIQVDRPRWTVNPLPSKQAADLVVDVQKLGDHACVLPDVRGALMGYAAAAPEVTRPRELSRCDLSLATSFDPRLLLRDARSTFRYRWRLPAETSYLVYSRLRPGTIR